MSYKKSFADAGEANLAPQIKYSASVAGSSDGLIKLWKLGDHYRTISLLFEVPVKGFVNSLAFTSNGDKLIAAVGQEHRLGRWWRMKEAANRILVISLNKKAVE